MNWLIMIKTVLQLLPSIIDAIKAIEDAIPGSGSGEAKLAAIRGIIENVYNLTTDAVVKFTDLWPAIESAIAVLVGLFNSVGVFRKG